MSNFFSLSLLHLTYFAYCRPHTSLYKIHLLTLKEWFIELQWFLIFLYFYEKKNNSLKVLLTIHFLCNFFPLRSLKLPKNGAENGNTDQNAYMTLCIEPMNLRVKYRLTGSWDAVSTICLSTFSVCFIDVLLVKAPFTSINNFYPPS